MDRRRFLGGAALGGGAVLVNVLSGSAATGAGDDADVDKRRTRPSRLDNITRSEQGMSAGGLSKARLARMHHVMAGYVERGEVPGIVTLVSRRGAVHVDAIGRQAIGGDVMRRDTIFRIASMTKPITAAATMILVEECKLRLDEPGGPAPPRTGQPQGAEAARRAARRDRAGEAADHSARPADPPHGIRSGPRAAGHVSDPEGHERAADRDTFLAGDDVAHA